MLISKIGKKESGPFVFLRGEKIVSYDKVQSAGRKIMVDLNSLIQKQKIVVTGPPVWSYQPIKGKLKLKAGFPVKKGTRGRAPFAARREPAWKCVSAEFEGPMEQMIDAWEEFFAAIEKKGLDPTGERREMYRTWVAPDSRDNVTELQVRLKK